MDQRFTGRARHVVFLAREEARAFKHDHVGTEHILIGLLAEGEGVAARALESLGMTLAGIRQQIEEIAGRGEQAPIGHIPLTSRAAEVLDLALRESLALGHDHIGTEHILLGLVREGDGDAVLVLTKLGAHLDRVRRHVMVLLSRPRPETGLAPSAEMHRLARIELQLGEIIARLSAIERRLD